MFSPLNITFSFFKIDVEPLSKNRRNRKRGNSEMKNRPYIQDKYSQRDFFLFSRTGIAIRVGIFM